MEPGEMSVNYEQMLHVVITNAADEKKKKTDDKVLMVITRLVMHVQEQ